MLLVKFLRGVLWLCLGGAAVVTVGTPFVQTDRGKRAWESEAADKAMGRVHDPTRDLIRRLGEELVPYGGAPTIFVLSAGFLLASYSIELGPRRRRGWPVNARRTASGDPRRARVGGGAAAGTGGVPAGRANDWAAGTAATGRGGAGGVTPGGGLGRLEGRRGDRRLGDGARGHGRGHQPAARTAADNRPGWPLGRQDGGRQLAGRMPHRAAVQGWAALAAGGGMPQGPRARPGWPLGVLGGRMPSPPRFPAGDDRRRCRPAAGCRRGRGGQDGRSDWRAARCRPRRSSAAIWAATWAGRGCARRSGDGVVVALAEGLGCAWAGVFGLGAGGSRERAGGDELVDDPADLGAGSEGGGASDLAPREWSVGSAERGEDCRAEPVVGVGGFGHSSSSLGWLSSGIMGWTHSTQARGALGLAQAFSPHPGQVYLVLLARFFFCWAGSSALSA